MSTETSTSTTDTTSPSTESSTSTSTSTTTPGVTTSVYAEGTPVNGYYFSHDPRNFKKGHLDGVKFYSVDEKGNVTPIDATEFLSKVTFKDVKKGASTPEDAYDVNNTTFAYEVAVYYNDAPLTDATGADSFNNGEITGTIYGAEIHFADITAYNTPVSVVLNLSKEDFSTHERLPGAEFALRELDPNSSVISYRSNGSNSSETDENGCSSFELAEGRFYELKEEKPPKGYLITGSMKAYFKVMNGKLSMIEAEEDVPPSDWTEATSTADGTTFSLLSADSDSTTEMADAIITVYNYQGSMLPTTGGMGAEVIAMTGMVLLIVSVGGLFIRRLRKNDYEEQQTVQNQVG